MPFGEELYVGIGGRTGSPGLSYSTSEDDIRQKFTGYQKDNETGLDFAENRMYENRFGRFTAVDPLMSSGRSGIPQTWNRYTYCLNNAILCTDPSGLDGGIWAMQFNGKGVDLRYFESEEAMREENRIGNTEFCRMNGCNLWERYDRTYFLWDDQTATHLGADGVRTDFNVATVGQNYWDDLVGSFYSESGFSQGQDRLLHSLYQGQLKQDELNLRLGITENPKHLEMGGNPLRAAQQLNRFIRKYTVGEYDQLRKAAAGSGLTAHHVPQKAVMKRFVSDYDPKTAPSIRVPRQGHITRSGDRGVLSRNTGGFENPRQVLARDIME